MSAANLEAWGTVNHLSMTGMLAFLAGCLLLLLAARLLLPRRRRRWWRVLRFLPVTLCAVVGMGGTVAGGYLLWYTHRSPPPPEERALFRGVTFRRVVLGVPRPIVMSILRVDLSEPGVSVVVTEPRGDGTMPARTTTEFLRETGAQAAVNANLFYHWSFEFPFTYYPHPGDTVSVAGPAAAHGVTYGHSIISMATLYISADNRISVEKPLGPVFNAITGTGIIIKGGKSTHSGAGTQSGRTSVGADASGHVLFLVTVDGKQPGYSEGMTITEYGDMLAEVCPEIATAIVVDGGGSTTMAALGPGDKPVLLNSPINLGVVGWQRAVANHIGVMARPL